MSCRQKRADSAVENNWGKTVFRENDRRRRPRGWSKNHHVGRRCAGQRRISALNKSPTRCAAAAAASSSRRVYFLFIIKCKMNNAPRPPATSRAYSPPEALRFAWIFLFTFFLFSFVSFLLSFLPAPSAQLHKRKKSRQPSLDDALVHRHAITLVFAEQYRSVRWAPARGIVIFFFFFLPLFLLLLFF